jgi:hypothetical protein
VGVAQIVTEQPPATEVGFEQRLSLLGYDLLPARAVGVAQLDADDPAPGRGVVGQHHERRTDIGDHDGLGLEASHQWAEASLRLLNIEHQNLALRARAALDRDHQIAVVVADRRFRKPVRLLRCGENRLIVFLKGPDTMEADVGRTGLLLEFTAGFRPRQGSVVEARPVLAPSRPGELRPPDHVPVVIPGFDVAEMPGSPIRSAHAGRIGQTGARFVYGQAGDRDGSVRGQLVGVEQRSPLAVGCLGHVQDRLVL